MCNQTPFEQAGYTKDDTFVVVKVNDNEDVVFSLGSIIKLEEDDKTSCPYFTLIQGYCNPKYASNGGKSAYEDLDNLVKIAKSQTPFEQLGYKPSDTFVMIKDGAYLTQGTKLALHKDDGTNIPYFKVISHSSKYCGEVFNPSLDQLCKLID